MSSNTSGNQNPPFPIFDGENYNFWCVKMRTIFVSNDLWEYVEDGYNDQDDVSTLSNAQKQQLKEHYKKDAKALTFI